MKYSTKKYLCIEPYVFLDVKEDRILLYNSLDYKHLEFKLDKENIDIFVKLMDVCNMYCVELSKTNMCSHNFNKIVTKIRQYYMGDIINVVKNQKPIQLKPEPILLTEYDNSEIFSNNQKMVLKYLNQLTIYINNDVKLVPELRYAFKQFLFPINENKKCTMQFDIVKSIVEQIKFAPLNNLNIIGGDIFSHKDIYEITAYLRSLKTNVNLHYYWDGQENKIEKIEKLIKNDIKLIIYLFKPSNKKVNELLYKLKNIQKNIFLKFIISNYKDLEEINYLQKNESINRNRMDFIPLYTKRSNLFWEKEIYFKKYDVLNLKLSKQELLARKVINTINFGQLIIKSDGRIYSNINHKSIGNIYNGSIKEAISKELINKNSWFHLRKNVIPCNKCILNLFCPPITNTEYALKRYNLCTDVKI